MEARGQPVVAVEAGRHAGDAVAARDGVVQALNDFFMTSRSFSTLCFADVRAML